MQYGRRASSVRAVSAVRLLRTFIGIFRHFEVFFGKFFSFGQMDQTMRLLLNKAKIERGKKI